MCHTGATMGENRSKEQRRLKAATQTEKLTLSTKSRLTNWVATATPLQRHCHHPHRIPDRLMYDTGATMGENRSKEQKVTATERQKVLTSSQNVALRIDPPHLRRSKAIAIILIEFLIDWCIIQVQHWVRRHRRTKSDNNRATKSTYHVNKKRLTNRSATSTPLQRHCRHLHWIPDRLMYGTCNEIG